MSNNQPVQPVELIYTAKLYLHNVYKTTIPLQLHKNYTDSMQYYLVHLEQKLNLGSKIIHPSIFY